jgi:Ankyrin repeats (3 copies)
MGPDQAGTWGAKFAGHGIMSAEGNSSDLQLRRQDMNYGVIMSTQFNLREVAMLLFVSFMSFIANLPDNILRTDLIDRRLVLATLIAVVVIALFRYLQVLMLMVICILAVGANLPEGVAASLGISQTALLVSLGAIIAITLVNRYVRVLPTGIDSSDEEDLPEDEMSESAVHAARHALLKAISKGDVETINGLLAMNVGVNFTQDGSTPLHLAAEKGYPEIVQILIDHGARFNVKNASGKTPLDIALDKKKFVRTTEVLFNASRPMLARAGQSDSRRGEDDVWRDQY